jgi:aminopeptidase
MEPFELERYARVVLRGCLAFRRGDTLIVNANPAHRELVVALAEAAYRAGAVAVDAVVVDPRVEAARIRSGSDAALGHTTSWREARDLARGRQDVATVQVLGEFEPGAVAGLPAERVSLDARRGRSRALERARAEFRLRNTVCAWPTEGWAARVFPDLPVGEGLRELARDLLSFCRVGPDDPPGVKGWVDHLARLRRRAARLTKLDLVRIEVRDRGTDLQLGLAEHSLWRGGGETDRWGRRIAMNLPTEENFVSPHAAATEGTFRCSRPRTFGGRVLDGLAGEFRNGRLVRLEAAREGDRDWFACYLAATPGAERVGEIALVDASSRIGATGRSYYNELIDENAVAHFAFGSGYTKTRSVPVDRRRYGVNRSSTHVDVMIGTQELEAVGVTRRGRRVTLVSDGTWRI